jgi:hypothetical protein
MRVVGPQQKEYFLPLLHFGSAPSGSCEKLIKHFGPPAEPKESGEGVGREGDSQPSSEGNMGTRVSELGMPPDNSKSPAVWLP